MGRKTTDRNAVPMRPAPRKMAVLVADAERLVFDGVRAWLADMPHLDVVAYAATGLQLLDLVSVIPPQLVLMDVSLPGLDGIDTMRELRNRKLDMTVLGHSALTDIEYVNSMLTEGANGYLVKGGPKEEMQEAIDCVLAGGCYISPQARANVRAGYKYCGKQMGGEYIGLSQREREIIRMVALEHTNDEIAAALFISTDTVKTHRRNLMAKLNVRSVAGLAKYAHDRRWV